MKKNTLLHLVTIAFTLFATACSSTYDASPANPEKSLVRNPLQGEFTAQVNGVIFRADSKYFTDETNGNVRFISFSGVQDNYDKNPELNQTISLSINDYMGPKTYLSADGLAGTYINVDTVRTYTYTTIPWDTLSSITITSDQGSWEGTFKLLVVPNIEDTYDTLVISDGSFSIPK